jgi:hypothetical protein
LTPTAGGDGHVHALQDRLFAERFADIAKLDQGILRIDWITRGFGPLCSRNRIQEFLATDGAQMDTDESRIFFVFYL